MTDRQFVKSYYPNAELDYKVITMNTLRAKTFYNIVEEKTGGKWIGRLLDTDKPLLKHGRTLRTG